MHPKREGLKSESIQRKAFSVNINFNIFKVLYAESPFKMCIYFLIWWSFNVVLLSMISDIKKSINKTIKVKRSFLDYRTKGEIILT